MTNYGITGSDLPGVPADLSADINQRQLSNPNTLKPTSYKFAIGRLPKVEYMCQSVSLPGIEVEPLEYRQRFVDIKEIGKASYATELELTFLVDENMENWRSIHDWMRSTTPFEDFTEVITPTEDHKSDATLVVTTSAMNANISIDFKGVFCRSLGGIEFDSSNTDLGPIIASMTLSFDSYSISTGS
jgi:hypothetical protein